MDISTAWPKSDIHTWIYPWIYPWISISTATLTITYWFRHHVLCSHEVYNTNNTETYVALSSCDVMAL